MGSCRVGFRPGLRRSAATARRRASRAWQDVLAAWASQWARCQDAMVGRSRAGRGGSAFATRARCVGGGTGRSSPSVAFLRHWAADHWSNGSTGFWRQFGSSAQDDEHIGAGARRGARLRDLAYGVSKLFSQPCVRLVALRVLWTARAARRPFLFWIGRRARSGCAGPPGPRPLAPPRMRPSESGWDDDDSTGHRGGELRR